MGNQALSHGCMEVRVLGSEKAGEIELNEMKGGACARFDEGVVES